MILFKKNKGEVKSIMKTQKLKGQLFVYYETSMLIIVLSLETCALQILMIVPPNLIMNWSF